MIIILLLLMPVLSFGFSPIKEYKAAVSCVNKDHKAACKQWSGLVANNPENKDYLYNCGTALYQADKIEDAEKCFQKVVQQDLSIHEREETFFNLGCAQAKQKKYKPAIESFEEVLKNNAENQRAKSNIEKLKKLLEEQQKQEQEGNESSDAKDKEDRQKEHQKEKKSSQDKGNKKQLDKNGKEQKENSEHNNSSNTTDQQEQQPQQDANKDSSKDNSSNKKGEEEGGNSKGDQREEDSSGESGTPPDSKNTDVDKNKPGQQPQHSSPDGSDSDNKDDSPEGEKEQDDDELLQAGESEETPLTEEEIQIAEGMENHDRVVGKNKKILMRKNDYGW